MKRAPALSNDLRWLRTRTRADGSLRLWWEPSAAARKAGFAAVEFDARHRKQAEREAAALNRQVNAALASGQRKPVARGRVTVDQVITEIQRSVWWQTRLRPATRQSYRAQWKLIAEKWGDAPIADFTKKTLHVWYETLFASGKKTQAQRLIAAFSVLFSYAERMDWRPENSNPCFNLGTVTTPPRNRRVSWAELDALQAAAGACGFPSVWFAAALSIFQGQRTTDVLAARRGDFEQIAVRYPGAGADTLTWVWWIERSKNGTDGAMPLHDEVQGLVAARLGQPGPADGFLILEERLGRPYDQHLFSKRWGLVRAKAAETAPSVADLQFRDLRRSFSVLARIGGASPQDAADVLGNSAGQDPRLRKTYMPPTFFTAARAVSAVQRPKETPERKVKS